MDAEITLEGVKDTAKRATDAVSEAIENNSDMLRKIMIAGGLIVAGYAISRLFADSDDDEDEEEDNSSSTSSLIFNTIKGAATAAALAYIRSAGGRFVDGFTSRTNDSSETA